MAALLAEQNYANADWKTHGPQNSSRKFEAFPHHSEKKHKLFVGAHEPVGATLVCQAGE